MQIIKKNLVPVLIMLLVSVVLLLVLSLLTYIYKWQADKALLGITITYILVGFFGGKIQKRLSQTTDMSRKLVEGIILGIIFIGLLLCISLFVIEKEWSFTSRFFMVGMLITGSVCLGRIL